MYAVISEKQEEFKFEIKKESIYKDNFSKKFTDIETFLNFIKEREKNSEWFRIKSNDIFISEQESDDYVAKLFRIGDWEVFEDTINNTKLLMISERGTYPLRDTAIKTLLERAKISGTALARLKRNIFAEVINHCLNIAKGDALIKIQDRKIAAIHGGDQCDYAVINMYDIFFESNKYLISKFAKHKFTEAYFDHSITSAVWELSNEFDLIEEYSELLDRYEMKLDIKPAIRVLTSDVGLSGANIYPIIVNNDKNIVLGSVLKLNHKNKADIYKFKENLEMIFTQFTKGINELKELLEIKIYYPKNCMGNIMKRISLPKKYSMEAIELFIAQNGERTTTAHDIFYGISEILFIMSKEGESSKKIIDAEENISKALSIRWTSYDIAGDFNW